MKIFKILIAAIIFFSYSFNSLANEQKKDCSSIDTCTGVGMYEKWNCEKGFEVLKKKVKRGKIFELIPPNGLIFLEAPFL